MSFDNNYPHRKDWRKPYRKSKRFDRSCRPHGNCGYCEQDRLFTNMQRVPLLDEEAEARLTDHIRSRIAS